MVDVQILELLEIPQLMDTCVRNEYFEVSCPLFFNLFLLCLSVSLSACLCITVIVCAIFFYFFLESLVFVQEALDLVAFAHKLRLLHPHLSIIQRLVTT